MFLIPPPPELGFTRVQILVPKSDKSDFGGGGWRGTSEASDEPGGGMANQLARKLRKTLTSQEVKIWVHLRSWRNRGFHFRRQSPRDGYIVDFVCLKHRLVV